MIIASPADTHAALIMAASRAGKAVFCEKPIDLDIGRINAALAAVEKVGVALMVGFNRRFDPSFAALRDAVRDGRIGALELVAITSRDPAPPPPAYIAASGGLFRDMMIHDMDMARWILDEEPVEVFGSGGMLRAENRFSTTVQRMDANGTATEKPVYFFLERYADAYRLELDHFLDCIAERRSPSPGADDGRRALVLADAAAESALSGLPVRL